MQEDFKEIYNLAVKELPHKIHLFKGEKAVMHLGFKSSLKDKTYYWQDTRYSNYYEPVDPKITKKVLERGFCNTLTEVMKHADKERVLNIAREIEKKDALIGYWTKESSKLWTEYNKKRLLINKNSVDEVKKQKKDLLKKRYEKDKSLYQKKRRVIMEERDDLKGDLKFFQTRIKLYNN